MNYEANVIGATGMVGKQLVKLLLHDERFEKVRIFVRRDSGLLHPKLEQLIVDFGDFKSWSNQLKGDILYSTLGTTVKQAGGQKNQYAVDFTLNYELAKAARANGVKNYVLVSSMGANANSRIFYSRMKGELDEAVLKLGFEKCCIIRPGPLTGDRENKRLMEELFVPVIRVISKIAGKKYRPISDVVVAAAMINATVSESNPKSIYEGEEVFRLAAKN